MPDITGLHMGLSNAWIGSVIILLTMAGVAKNKKLAKRLLDVSWHTPLDRKASRLNTVLMLGMMFFLPSGCL